MPSALVESIMSYVSPQIVNSLSSRLGGSASAVQAGLGTSVTALLGSIASNAGNTGLMSQIFNLVSGSNSQGVLGNLQSLASGATASTPGAETGSRLLSMLFGNKLASVESMIGQHSGLGAAAGSSLLSLAAPLVAGGLGQQIRDQNLTASSFANLLSSEKSKLLGLLPAGLGSLFSGVSTAGASTVAAAGAAADKASGGMKPLLAVLGVVILAFLAWWLSRGCNKPQEAVNAPTQAAPAAATPAPGPLGAFLKKKLPDGTELNIPENGIENKLIAFIEDPSKAPDKTTWFEFDRLNFDTGKATLQPDSGEQLQDIAAILKAYPKVKLKIGGYTDNTGSPASNLKLSQDRADTVTHDLIQRGIDASRVEAKGYGEEHPTADNSTEEGRAKNRRIALLVTAK